MVGKGDVEMKMFWVESGISFGVVATTEEEEKFLNEIKERAFSGVIRINSVPPTTPEKKGHYSRIGLRIFEN